MTEAQRFLRMVENIAEFYRSVRCQFAGTLEFTFKSVVTDDDAEAFAGQVQAVAGRHVGVHVLDPDRRQPLKFREPHAPSRPSH